MARHMKDDSRAPRDPGDLPEQDVPDLEDILGEFGYFDDIEDADTLSEEYALLSAEAPGPETSAGAEETSGQSPKTPDALPEGKELSSVFTEADAPSPEDEADAPGENAPGETVSETAAAPVKRPAPKRKPAAPPRKSSSGKKKRRRKRSRRKKDRFKLGLIIYLLFLGMLIVGLLVMLWIGLDRSQQRMDAENEALAKQRAEEAERQAHERAVYRAPQLAFEQWLAGADADYWTDLWVRGHDGGLDDPNSVKEYLSSLLTAAEPFKSLDYTAEKPVYVLKNGDRRLAEITLSGSDVSWSVSDVRLLIEGHEKASVRVASGSRVYCNGVALGPDYIVDSSSYFTYDPLRDKLINPVTWDTYEVSGLLLEPSLTADPPEGGIVTETAEGDFLLCLDEASGKPYQTRAVNFVKAYLNYYLNGYNGTWGNLYAALAYLTPGYQAYKDLQDTYNGVVWNSPYTNVDTSLTSAGDVVIWADNCYSTDVIYDAKGIQNGQQGGYAATMRIYFLKTDAGYIISNFEIL